MKKMTRRSIAGSFFLSLILLFAFAGVASAAYDFDVKAGDEITIATPKLEKTFKKYDDFPYSAAGACMAYEWSYLDSKTNTWKPISGSYNAGTQLHWKAMYGATKLRCSRDWFYEVEEQLRTKTLIVEHSEGTLEQVYTVNVKPTLDAYTAKSVLKVQIGEPVVISVKATGIGNISYLWLVKDGVRQKDGSYKYSYSVPNVPVNEFYQKATFEGQSTNMFKIWYQRTGKPGFAGNNVGDLFCDISTSYGETMRLGPYSPEITLVYVTDISNYTAKYDKATDTITLYDEWNQQTALKEYTDFSAVRDPHGRYMGLNITGINNYKGWFTTSINIGDNGNSTARPNSNTAVSTESTSSTDNETGSSSSGHSRHKKQNPNTDYSRLAHFTQFIDKNTAEKEVTESTTQPVQLETPVISKAKNTNKGITLQWDAVNGAEKYRVFKQKDTGSWVSVGTTTANKVTVPAEKLESGKTYVFTVRCEDPNVEKNYLSDYDKNGYSITYIKTPKLVSAKASSKAGQVKVTWEASPGAAQYRVFYKEEGAEKWTKAKLTTDTAQTVKGLTSGKTYYFTVRCLNADATAYTSGYDKTGLIAKVK